MRPPFPGPVGRGATTAARHEPLQKKLGDGHRQGRRGACYTASMPSRASKPPRRPPHPEKPPKRPRDINQLAYALVAEATGTAPPPKPERPKNPAAVALGKLGASKGGQARAQKLTAEERREVARKAALARWSTHHGLK
jgi:hypothetical protein